jgi:dipeptidyl aminopeptidase/acylaminoacyl peptidase
MNRSRVVVISIVAVHFVLLAGGRAASAEHFTVEQALAFPAIESVVAAKSGSRIAWIFDEQGVRNVWAAEAPQWKAHALTAFTGDEGKEISDLSLSADGSEAVFVRDADGGNWPPADGVHPNPLGMPVAQRVEIWTAPATGNGGQAQLLAEGDAPTISPQGDRVAYISGDQGFVATIGDAKSAQRSFFARGKTRDLVWSPDGSQLAFVSDRGSHSLVGVFRSATDPIHWMAPSSNRVAAPRWSPDGKRLTFVKLAGAGGPVKSMLDRHPEPFELWVADAATGEGHAVWNSPNTIAGSFPDTDGGANLAWGADDRLVFTAHLDGWPHLYSVSATGGEPLLLTPGPFMVEHVSMSPDGRTVVYAANTGTDVDDDERRHVFSVPVNRAQPQAITRGLGLEWSPVVTGDGQSIAYIEAGAKNSPLPAVIAIRGGKTRIIGTERVPADFAGPRFVQPRKTIFTSSDGLLIHGQLFDTNIEDRGKRPALIYVHGGPSRQMLLGFHYMTYYARDYAINQYLASRGFIVLSVNYRLGIGYGDAFNNPPGAAEKGAAEYQDVLAGAKYLRSLPTVDAKRLGIWGGSYGGFLAALALARNSDVFAAGVDLHGVHNWVSLLEREEGLTALSTRYEKPADLQKAVDLAWQSSPVADVNRWRSPVLFIHGDDDRNVDVSQTIDLVERLRARGVRYEELIIPDETHDWELFRSWVKVSKAAGQFLTRELGIDATR